MHTIKTLKSTGVQRLHQRLVIKGFKTSDAMHKFLQGPSNCSNAWSINEVADDWKWEGTGNDTSGLRAGTYAFAGGTWHNVKSMDPGMLAHC